MSVTYRDIQETPTKLEAARIEKSKGFFVGAEACSTQSGRVWYWYCIEENRCSTVQFSSKESATAAAIAHDDRIHTGRRQ